MTNDFITLEEYALCIKECLENVLFDNQMADDEKPLVIYATSSIAYAKLQERFANGQNIGPLITFYQSGIDLIQEQQMGAWKWMTVVRETGNYQMKAPVICSINYTITISALTERQADMLQTQIMMATPFHRPYYIKLKGQYVLIQNTEVSNLSSVDVGDNKDRVSQRQIILKIDRAYLDYDYKELYAGTISPSTEAFNYNDEDVSKELKNGAKILKDNTTIVDGTVNKNTSNSFAPFIYNVLDEKGNVIQTTQKGKSKVTLYSLEKTL